MNKTDKGLVILLPVDGEEVYIWVVQCASSVYPVLLGTTSSTNLGETDINHPPSISVPFCLSK